MKFLWGEVRQRLLPSFPSPEPHTAATHSSLTGVKRYLRSQLRQANSTLKNQLGQLTISPTLRWIFQCFQSVHFLQIATIKQISNLTQERLDILKFFPASCRAYYLLIST